MSPRPLPARADLDHLKRRAKDLLRGVRAGAPAALHRVRLSHPRFADATDAEIHAAGLRLADAQWCIAREHGERSWATLRDAVLGGEGARRDLPHHERIDDESFRAAVDRLDAGDLEGLRSLLRQDPSLATRRVRFESGDYFGSPGLLEFCAENPVRHGRSPANLVEAARAILDAGASRDPALVQATLGLIASGRVTREAGVQVPLLDLLCDHGADPAQAVLGALFHGETASVEALLHRGAPVTLEVAAGLGRGADVARLLPGAAPASRLRAMGLAAQQGHAGLVGTLLDAGVDPDRHLPAGGHAHATPLHLAVAGGHLAVVMRLVEGGARLDLRDARYDGTPLDWARHEGREAIAAYLEARGGASSSDAA